MGFGDGFPIGEPVNSLPHQEVAVPDYFEWVLGWRHFDINEEGVCFSVTHPFVWQKGETKARCDSPQPGVVHSDHHCGLNVFFEPNNMMYGSLHALVRGRGERFAIHPNGFRAEYAEIIAFVGGRNPSKKIQAAAKRYGVPLFKRRWNAEQYAKKNNLGDWFPKDRRPQRREIIRSTREVDWNEVPIGDMSNLLSNSYMLFVTALWICVLIGFLYGAITLGGVA